MGSGLRSFLPQIQLPPELSASGVEGQKGRVCMVARNPATSVGDSGLRVTDACNFSISVQSVEDR